MVTVFTKTGKFVYLNVSMSSVIGKDISLANIVDGMNQKCIWNNL